MAGKGPFLLPGTDAPSKDWRDLAEQTATPDMRRPTADEQRRGCVKGAEGY